MAGLLGIRLEKKAAYCLGNGAQPTPQKLRLGCRAAQIAGGFGLGFLIVILHLLK